MPWSADESRLCSRIGARRSAPIHFDRSISSRHSFLSSTWTFLVQFLGQLIQAQLMLFAFAFQAGPFADFWQVVVGAVEHFGRAAQVSAAGNE